jgi:hypothetical protein
LHGGLLLFNMADIGPAGALVEQGEVLGEQVRGADGVDFDAAVVEVAGVTPDAHPVGVVLGEVAVADPLHAAADQVTAGDDGSAGHPQERIARLAVAARQVEVKVSRQHV